MAFHLPTTDRSLNKNSQKLIKFLMTLKQLISNEEFCYKEIVDLLVSSEIGIILWIRQPPDCCSEFHPRECTLSNCFDKCYHSIVPNGACGFIVEYVLNERQKLPVEQRDDLYINVYAADFVKNFSNHVTNVCNNNNWGREVEKSHKYKYENLIQWLHSKKTNFYKNMLNKDFWFTTNIFSELQNQSDYIIFVQYKDPKYPYISDIYFNCDFNGDIKHDIRIIEKLLENPNLAALSQYHFYLVSSNKSLISELQESIMNLCREYKMIFDLEPDNDKLRELLKNITTFSRWGKVDSTKRRSYHC